MKKDLHSKKEYTGQRVFNFLSTQIHISKCTDFQSAVYTRANWYIRKA